ncbi:hypothetical protein ACA910_020914 [Epithemia clementina (nom. ined.)]
MGTTIRRKVVSVKQRTVGQSSSSGSSGKAVTLGRSLSFLESVILLVSSLLLICSYLCGPSLLVMHWRRMNQEQSSANNPKIQVWDSVLSEESMEELRQAFLKRVEERGPEKRAVTVTFPWPTAPSELARRHRVEQMLSDIMDQLHPEHASGTEPRFLVEYWERQSWMLIAAHADQDEGYFNKELELGNVVPVRHPQFGHVLYLQQGRESFSQAPTLVFANASKGGEMVLQKSKEKVKNDAMMTAINDVELLVVPNIPGRLLRFQGHLLHSVPRPADLYLHNINGKEPATVVATSRNAELYGRSVVLFNIWPVNEPPGIETTQPIYNIDNGNEATDTTEPELPSSCFPRHQWKSVTVSKAYEGSWVERFVSALFPWWTTWPLHVPLMGVEVQRGMKDKVVRLKAGSSVKMGLTSGKQDPSPKRVFLEQSKPVTWNQITNHLKQELQQRALSLKNETQQLSSSSAPEL